MVLSLVGGDSDMVKWWSVRYARVLMHGADRGIWRGMRQITYPESHPHCAKMTAMVAAQDSVDRPIPPVAGASPGRGGGAAID
mmetsp:Transcript_15992/g.45902  ORF Transcript_15992/g.45902 Transcript_15992/m.45902 type:complete len:83 (-) Transcript_15992:1649-1897(-)